VSDAENRVQKYCRVEEISLPRTDGRTCHSHKGVSPLNNDESSDNNDESSDNSIKNKDINIITKCIQGRNSRICNNSGNQKPNESGSTGSSTDS
jgi:hypothetical protein